MFSLVGADRHPQEGFAMFGLVVIKSAREPSRILAPTGSARQRFAQPV